MSFIKKNPCTNGQTCTNVHVHGHGYTLPPYDIKCGNLRILKSFEISIEEHVPDLYESQHDLIDYSNCELMKSTFPNGDLTCKCIGKSYAVLVTSNTKVITPLNLLFSHFISMVITGSSGVLAVLVFYQTEYSDNNAIGYYTAIHTSVWFVLEVFVVLVLDYGGSLTDYLEIIYMMTHVVQTCKTSVLFISAGYMLKRTNRLRNQSIYKPMTNFQVDYSLVVEELDSKKVSKTCCDFRGEVEIKLRKIFLRKLICEPPLTLQVDKSLCFTTIKIER